jgi:uncharacterized protein (UPF0332 family)
MQVDQSVKNLEIVEIPKEFIETVEIDKKIIKFLNEEYKMRLSPFQGQMGRENRVVRVPFVISDLVITRKLAIGP